MSRTRRKQKQQPPEPLPRQEEPSPATQPAADDEQSLEQVTYDPAGGCLLRVFWMLVGNLLLLAAAYAITQSPRLLGPADAFFWLAFGSLLAARYADVKHFQGRTAEGEPATMADWRRYAALLGGISLGVWLVAHLVAHLVA
jgi:hypothetical protein